MSSKFIRVRVIDAPADGDLPAIVTNFDPGDDPEQAAQRRALERFIAELRDLRTWTIEHDVDLFGWWWAETEVDGNHLSIGLSPEVGDGTTVDGAWEIEIDVPVPPSRFPRFAGVGGALIGASVSVLVWSLSGDGGSMLRRALLAGVLGIAALLGGWLGLLATIERIAPLPPLPTAVALETDVRACIERSRWVRPREG